MHVKKGDKVIVITGSDKGKQGEVLKIMGNKVVVEGVRVAKRSTRPRKQGEKGGIVSINLPIDASNVKLAEKKAKTTKKTK
jgi:large subunit ribosomal protein L24